MNTFVLQLESSKATLDAVGGKGANLSRMARAGFPVPPGVYGDKMLITTLFSRTQPLNRYELSDSVRLARGPNSNGFPFTRIGGIQWRTEGILRLPAVSGDEVAVHSITFHHVLDSLP